ncbi:hypothetical protein SRHO_G00177070 [Serrasalmus rhombeus]
MALLQYTAAELLRLHFHPAGTPPVALHLHPDIAFNPRRKYIHRGSRLNFTTSDSDSIQSFWSRTRRPPRNTDRGVNRDVLAHLARSANSSIKHRSSNVNFGLLNVRSLTGKGHLIQDVLRDCDSMAYNNGQKFSTFDKDQDSWPGNCAKSFLGAFWYNGCHYANPNGIYLWGKDGTLFAIGDVWYHWKTFDYSLKSITMKIRPFRAFLALVLPLLVGSTSVSQTNCDISTNVALNGVYTIYPAGDTPVQVYCDVGSDGQVEYKKWTRFLDTDDVLLDIIWTVISESVDPSQASCPSHSVWVLVTDLWRRWGAPVSPV